MEITYVDAVGDVKKVSSKIISPIPMYKLIINSDQIDR